LKQINENLISEIKSVYSFLFFNIDKKHWVNHPDNITLTKLNQLQIAASIGLNIPKTIVSNNKNKLMHYINYRSNYITKGIDSLLNLEYNNDIYTTYTKKVSTVDINEKSEYLFPSLIQEEIKKEIELRIFYIAGKCFSMVIFSQDNDEMKTDFRKYDYINPVNWEPYKLPSSIEKKICVFMNKVNLQTGSIDMIKTSTDNYFFLEVNPCGQFEMVSFPCNYYLEKIIAQYLIKRNGEKN
jgi:ATP-GRASP peptide maturase of grasp-with-spasm system